MFRVLLVLLLAILAVPAPPAHADRAAARDTVAAGWLQDARRLQGERRWAAMDSVAVRIVERLAPRAGADSNVLARALVLRGFSRFERQLYSDSVGPASFEAGIRTYRRMAHPDTGGWIGGLDTWARLLLNRDRPDSALRLLDEARALCRPPFAGADTSLAILWLTTGRAYRQMDRHEAAIAALDSCRDLRVRHYGEDHPRVAEALAEVGAVHARAGRLEEAVRTLERAVGVLEAAGPAGRQRLHTALAELAGAQTRAGDIARSIETIERQVAEYVAREGASSPFMIPPLYNIGLRLHEFGDYAGANSVFAGLLPRAEASLGPGNGRTENVRAMAGVSAMLAGDTAAAAVHLERARAYLLSRPPDLAHMSQQIEVYRSMLFLRRGDLAAARRAATEGLERERATSRPVQVVMMLLLDQLASVQIAAGDSAGLAATLSEATGRFGDPSRAEAVVHGSWLRLRARAEHWLGRPSADASALACEAAERERLSRNVRALSDTRALQLAGELGDGLALLVARTREGADAGVETAWDRLVRWRGLVTSELAARRAPHAAAADTALATAHAAWVSAMRRHARLEVAGATAPAELAAVRAEAEVAERRYAALAEASGVRRDTASVSLGRVRERLAPGEALVSIVLASPPDERPRWVAFVTRGPAGALHRVDLGPAAELAGPLAAWRAALSAPPARGAERRAERECRRLGAEVRARTWDRWASLVAGARSVVLVADGELADLPWGALPEGTARWLVERDVVVRTPGAERELLESPARDGSGMLAVGDPDFDWTGPDRPAKAPGLSGARAPDSAAAAAAAIARSFGAGCNAPPPITLGSLPGARAEVDDIAREWGAIHADQPVTRLVGAAATEQAFKSRSPGHAVLHLATHGIAWGDSCAPVYEGTRGVGGVSPLAGSPAARAKRPAAPSAPPAAGPASGSPWTGRRVWLALAGANHARAGAAGEDDGLLTADEVVTLDLSDAEWVVLSACQSGVGRSWPLEGSAGMRRAFRLAGARAVIASQWSISDEATRAWMRAFYAAGAHAGSPVADAMAAAGRSVLEERRRAARDTHPFWWAAFTATGD